VPSATTLPVQATTPPVHKPTLAERQHKAAQKLEKLRPLSATQPSRPFSPTSVCWHPDERVLAPEDELDDLVRQAAAQYEASPSLEHFVKAMRDPRGDFNQHVGHIAHPAAHLLNHLRCSGAPVTCQGTQWTFAQKAATLTRGPHQSASKHIPFHRQEFVDMIHKGQWTVLPAILVLHEPQIHLSPLGFVPQRHGGRERLVISDYTFFGLNHETVPLSPSECMQFVRALWRILRHGKSANPHHGPIYLSKIDIADGFYRICVRASDVPKLGILFSAALGEEYMVGFPLALPMGWTESLKIFTAATETVAEMTNMSLKSGERFPAHHLEVISETPPPPAPLLPKSTPSLEPTSLPTLPLRPDAPNYGPPLALWDVYVHDFLVLVQGGRRTRLRVKRALLHSLDQVMRPLDSADSSFRQDPASVKNMGKGDVTWATLKTILGWILDTLDKTISLPPHRLVRVRDILDSISPNQRRVYLQVAASPWRITFHGTCHPCRHRPLLRSSRSPQVQRRHPRAPEPAHARLPPRLPLTGRRSGRPAHQY
jgi:hypothetical protein